MSDRFTFHEHGDWFYVVDEKTGFKYKSFDRDQMHDLVKVINTDAFVACSAIRTALDDTKKILDGEVHLAVLRSRLEDLIS